MATSTPARSATLMRETTADTPRSTSSPASASGLPLLDWLDGLTTDALAPSPVLASPLVLRAKDWVSPIPGTSGQTPVGSSASCGLTSSLVSRLQQRARGSILWRLTWKASATPSGRPLFRLQASAAPTFDNAFTGWPTPTTPSGGQTVPPGTSATGRKPDGSKAQVTLELVAQMAGWPTPRSSDTNGAGLHGTGGLDLRTTVLLAGWPTPMAGSPATSTGSPAGNTESSRETVRVLTGLPAGMQSGARLRAGHSRWLMRIPAVWDACAPTATRSISKRRPTS